MTTNDVLIIGGGVGGTIVANLVAKEVGARARVTLLDATGTHVYQPGFLYVAVGQEKPENLCREEQTLLRSDVKLVVDRATLVNTASKKVVLASGKIDVKPLITDRFSFEESVEAFDFAKAMPPASVKVQIEMPR